MAILIFLSHIFLSGVGSRCLQRPGRYRSLYRTNSPVVSLGTALVVAIYLISDALSLGYDADRRYNLGSSLPRYFETFSLQKTLVPRHIERAHHEDNHP
jgi:hypothetical protein